jgi:hypothetical protein
MGGDAVLGWVRLGLPVIATLARLLCHAGPIRDGTPFAASQPRGQPKSMMPGASNTMVPWSR